VLEVGVPDTQCKQLAQFLCFHVVLCPDFGQ
jgi:hypothetical protein